MKRFFSGVKGLIEDKIRASFNTTNIEVINDSWMHKRGDETHFKVLVVSNEFNGKTQVARQRLINQALKEIWDNGIHSISIVAKTPTEFVEDDKITRSPGCMGDKNIS